MFTIPSTAEEVILRHSFAGNISFALTGNTLRDENNTCDPITRSKSSSRINLPIDSVVEAAYLYWSGSGPIDSTARLNRTDIPADVSYIETFQGNAYYSSKADVTDLVKAAASNKFTVSRVTFDGSDTYCDTKGAYAGWALAVIYQRAGEPLRVINVFDGFKNFWGSEFALTPDNFVIALDPSGDDGKHAHITWEGDEGNSEEKNTYRESLTFEGYDLFESGFNPKNNQFNSYSNVNGVTSGVDIDEYEIGDYLTAGDTSVTTTYSTGQDAVFLTAELISVPNALVSDLELTHTVSQQPIRGQDLTFSLNVKNLGPSDANNVNTINSEIRVEIDKTLGLNFDSFEGQNWNCTNTASTVPYFYCLYLPQIIKNSSASNLKIHYSTDENLSDSFLFSAIVSGTEFDHRDSNNNTNQQFTNIPSPDFSTSEKLVFDLNGGLVNEGDVLRYQINIKESAGYDAKNITVIDYLPLEISSATVISAPDNVEIIASTAGSNSTITISGISLNANQTAAILIDATLKSSGLSTSSPIINHADISSVASGVISISSQSIYVSAPANASSGYKPLYIHNPKSSNTVVDADPGTLSRQAPAPADSHYVNISRKGHSNGDTMTWTLDPSLQAEFQFSNATANAYLCLRSFQPDTTPRKLRLEILAGSNVIGTSTATFSLPGSEVRTDLFSLAVPLSNTSPIPAGTSLSLRIKNLSNYGGIKVFSLDDSTNTAPRAPGKCYIELPAKTVINVDNISLSNADDIQTDKFSLSDTLNIEAIVSDPFGSADITDIQLSLYNPSGQIHNSILEQSMNIITDSGAATKVAGNSTNISFQEGDLTGEWRVHIIAKEGYEDDISHSADIFFTLSGLLPTITFNKSVNVLSDPIHGDFMKGSNNPKAIPGSTLVYTITTTNTGPGEVKTDSVFITDLIPDNTIFSVASIQGGGPIQFQNINNSSGLTYQFIDFSSINDDVEFSKDNGDTFNYIPSDPDNDGLDEQVTNFRINPKGTFKAPIAGESQNQFTIKFRVQLK